MTSRLSLERFLAAFGDDPGVLPDGAIPRSHGSDWPKIVEALARAGWAAAWNPGGPAVLPHHLEDPSFRHSTFAVHPDPGIHVNFFPGDDGIVFDIDLREFVSQDKVDALVVFMAVLGRALGEPVTISQEGDFEAVVLRYEPKSDSLSASAPTPQAAIESDRDHRV